MKTLLLVLYFFRVCLNIGLADTEITEVELTEVELTDIDRTISFNNNAINGTIYRTVKRYLCSVRQSNDSELLVYGTREWSFPAQDVTLNLDYPTKNNPSSIQYLLTEVMVIVHFEGSSSAGFITSGGMMRDHISMKFIFSNITRLSYQFYLYGVPIQLFDNTENFTTVYNIC